MAKIDATRIATSYPIDICKGVALMPWAGTIRAGTTLSSRPEKPIVRIKPKTILLWRFSGQAGYQLFAGVCGPAYAASFTVDGETNGRDVTLSVTDDQAAAGLFAGVKVVFPGEFRIDSGSVTYSWRHGFGVKWRKALQKKFNPSVDLLALAIKLIEKLMEDNSDTSKTQKGEEIEGETEESKKAREKDDSKEPEIVSLPSWGMYDEKSGQFAKNKGVVTPEPTYTITVNLVPLVPQLLAVDKALKTVWGGFSLGPKLKLIMPVNISFGQVYLDEAEVRNLEFKDGKLSGETDAPVAAVNTLRVDVQHNPQFTLGASFYMSISVCKLFSYDPETETLRLDQLLGVEVSLGTYCSAFTNAVGEMEANANPPGSCSAAPVEVVLEP